MQEIAKMAADSIVLKQSFKFHGGQQNATAKPFALQFTSLILIILTFTVGALFRQTPPVPTTDTLQAPAAVTTELNNIPAPNDSAAQSIKALSALPPVGTLAYNDLFVPNTGTVNEEKVFAVAQFLLQHDINATVKIYLDQAATPFSPANANDLVVEQEPRSKAVEKALSSAVARSISLQRYLLAKGVPAFALDITAVEKISAHQAEITFVPSINVGG
ncbi:hypothetical protein OAO01_09670 [Oligoflexia bacterium]|nr:hypothetical protein [Oligoflexia bacterium]